ncbi:retrovirus-related pol polyprotein from transposon TNT 1-94 [Tanacetum coccineum]|uniref:Retrovirus-related pol polyprotein from transposon TNT 1-94 n=1 Tax=Tanacetum coccineum TaxID=301880 RepID=A0ABQ5F0M6_9ASTR
MLLEKSLKLSLISPVELIKWTIHISFCIAFPIDVANLPHDPLTPELEDTAKIQVLVFLAMPMMIMTWKLSILLMLIKVWVQRLILITWNLPLFKAEELLQFKIKKVWTLVDLPSGKKAIGTKWVYRNKKNERGIVVRNKARLVAQGAENAQLGLHDSSMGELTFFLVLQVKQKEDGIFISQEKYVGEILKKFGFFSVRTASTPLETNKALTKDKCAARHIFILLDEVTTVRLQVSTARPNLVLLVKSEGIEGFHEIIDFLTLSHIYYALTECPTLYISLIEQFWQTAALSTTEDGVHAITTTIDGRDKIITEASIRRHLKL